jgi:hypothetical protein
MVLPETALASASHVDGMTLEQAAGASGTRLKVAARPATVGATWMDLFHPGTPSPPSLEARVRVVADIAGALIQIHDNGGLPRPHRRHGRLTPRHVLVGVDGSASLFTAREPFSKLLPPQPDLGYLAPELLTQSGPSTQQSDVFSLGALLWEALDNGRLFPHRRAAAISRLIARRSLPAPRIEEEWALPLGDVAMKALSQNPEERYLDGTAFWLALREHLPPPDAARAALSRLAQRALKLELTTDIRDTPPYLASGGMSLPPSTFGGMSRDMAPDAPARYSLHPEPSSRRSSLSRPPTHPPIDDPAWGLSEPPAPRVSQFDLSGPGFVRESEAPLVRKPRLELLESELPPPDRPSSLPTGQRGSFQPPPARHEADSPISTLHVNLPRELIDASLPFYVSSQPTQRPFPWGALSFAALIFFGVGAAVAFGAVTALRSGPVAEREPAPVQATPELGRAAAPTAQREPPPAMAPVPSATPAPAPVAAAPGGASDGTPAVTLPNDSTAPAAAPTSPVPATDPVAEGTTAATAGSTVSQAGAGTPPGAKAQATVKAPEPGHKPVKRARPKPRRPKLELAPVREPEPPAAGATDDTSESADPATDETKDDTNTGVGEELPFVDQPY